MKAKIATLLLVATVAFLPQGCNSSSQPAGQIVLEQTQSTEAPIKSIGAIPLPAGFVRPPEPASTFGAYLRELPIKQENNTVYLYNGNPKGNQDAHYAVVQMDVGNKDLQQCADAIMRLRAEYLWNQKRFGDIQFNFTNGETVAYNKYAAGYRVQLKNNKVQWIKQQQEDFGYATFRQYLELIFNYAGTASLSKELKPVASLETIQPGDVFIKGGFPGHAVIVADVALHPQTGEKRFLLAQSYMPAQEIQLLLNPMHPEKNPWYSNRFSGDLFTPEWVFEQVQLKRF